MSDLEQRLRAKAEQIRHDRPDTLGANLSALLIEAADALGADQIIEIDENGAVRGNPGHVVRDPDGSFE